MSTLDIKSPCLFQPRFLGIPVSAGSARAVRRAPAPHHHRVTHARQLCGERPPGRGRIMVALKAWPSSELIRRIGTISWPVICLSR